MTQIKVKMSKLGGLEKFSLVTGSIGLIVDTIALLTLIVHIVNSANDEQSVTKASLPTTPAMWIMALILIYSWFTLSWYFTRRHFINLQTNYANEKTVNQLFKKWDSTCFPIIGVVGLSMAPVWLMWIFFLFLLINPNEKLTNIFSITLIGGGFGGGLAGLLIGGGMYLIISTLMPVIHSDMSAFE